MSDEGGVLSLVRSLVAAGFVEVTRHAFRELADDEILIRDVLAGLKKAIVVEAYPDAKRGPSVLVLQRDAHDNPLHLVWGVPRETLTPAVLITAYRPDPARWSRDYTERRSP